MAIVINNKTGKTSHMASRFAKILTAIGHSRYAEIPAPEFTPTAPVIDPGEVAKKPHKGKRAYKRRDLTAEQSND